MTDLTNAYVTQPDIPAGMTIGEYRRARPPRLGRRRRLVLRMRVRAVTA
jgi:hypothetical protein